MKLLVVFALFALAAARVDYGAFEPTYDNFDPEISSGSIDKETILAILRRLLERLGNIRTQDMDTNEDPIDLEPALIAAFDDYELDPSNENLERIRDVLIHIRDLIWTEGFVRPGPLPEGSLEEMWQWARTTFGVLWPFDWDIPTPNEGLARRMRDAMIAGVHTVWPNGIPKPDTIQEVIDFISQFWRPVSPPSLTPEAIQTALLYLQEIFGRVFPGGLPEIDPVPLEAIRKLLAWARETLGSNLPPGLPAACREIKSVEDLQACVREIYERIPRPRQVQPTSSLDTIRDFVRQLVKGRVPDDFPPQINNIEDLKNFIRRILERLQRPAVAASPERISIFNAPLV